MDPNHQFSASSKWIGKFKGHQRISRRKFHRKRRSSASKNSIFQFFLTLGEILTKAKPYQILNVDETYWRVFDTGEFPWAPTGSEGAHINFYFDEKRVFTVLPTIDFASKNHPLSMITKCKTEFVEANWFGWGRNTLNQGISRWYDLQSRVQSQ